MPFKIVRSDLSSREGYLFSIFKQKGAAER